MPVKNMTMLAGSGTTGAGASVRTAEPWNWSLELPFVPLPPRCERVTTSVNA